MAISVFLLFLLALASVQAIDDSDSDETNDQTAPSDNGDHNGNGDDNGDGNGNGESTSDRTTPEDEGDDNGDGNGNGESTSNRPTFEDQGDDNGDQSGNGESTSDRPTPEEEDDDDYPEFTTIKYEEEEEEINETEGNLCRDYYVQCWNETDLKAVTQEFGDEVFDRHRVTNNTIDFFCTKTFPQVARCMAQESEEAIAEAHPGLFFENCTRHIENEATLPTDEIEEIGDFDRTYRFLCDPEVGTWCFFLKQRACVFERDESDYCLRACKNNGHLRQPSNSGLSTSPNTLKSLSLSCLCTGLAVLKSKLQVGF